MNKKREFQNQKKKLKKQRYLMRWYSREMKNNKRDIRMKQRC